MAGISLVEIMVSLAIGLVVVGAVLLQYLGTGKSSQVQSAGSQMAEDAQIVLSTLTREIQLAGYSQPIGFTAVTSTQPLATFSRTLAAASAPIYGCTGTMTTPSGMRANGCSLAGNSDAFEVNYEADASNSVLTSGGVPTNCVGNAITATSTGVGTGTATISTYFSSNIYFITRTAAVGAPELHCQGVSGNAQPLVENVERMTLLFGQGDLTAAPTPSAPMRPLRYLTADQVGTSFGGWDRVVSVRICVLMRSAMPVRTNEDSATFLDCDYTLQTPPNTRYPTDDRRLRRAFFTTVAVRNRSAF